MASIMYGIGKGVARKPMAVIMTIILLTMVFSYYGLNVQNEVDMEAFNPDHEMIKASDEVSERFGTRSYSVMILAKAKDKDLLEIDDLKELIKLEATLREDIDVAPYIEASPTNPTGMMTIADMTVMGHGLLRSREGMDAMIDGMNMSLSMLAGTLNDPMVPNQSKVEALMITLGALSQQLGGMAGGNGMDMGGFNETASLMTLDAIASEYGTDPVPSFLAALRDYDVAGAAMRTSAQVATVNSTIYSIMPHLGLLYGMPMGPEEATMVLMGLAFALPSIEAGALALDKAIPGIYFGASATLSKDFEKSGGMDAKGAIILTNFEVDTNSKERSGIEQGIYDAAKDREKDSDIRYGVLGNEIMMQEIQETMDFSQMFLLALVVILIIVILYFTFRSGFDTALTMGCLGMAILWSYGISILIGIQGSMIAQVVPILLVGLGVDYGIHMTMRFREERHKGNKNRKAVAIAVGTVGMALLLATITTSIGFMSNTVSSMSILRDFAIMTTIGIVSSFIIMTTFQPAVKLVVTSWSEARKRKKGIKVDTRKPKMRKKKMSRAVSLITVGARAGDKAPGAVIAIMLLLTAGAVYSASQLETVFDFRDFLPEGTETHETVIFMLDNFAYGDQEFGQFYIKGDVARPEVLQAMDEAIANTADDERVAPGVPSRSILSLFEKYSNPTSAQETNATFLQTWAVSDTNGDGIPESNVKELIDILYDWPATHDEVVGLMHRSDAGEYDAALVQIRVSSDNLRKADLLQAELEKDAKPLYELEDDGVLDEAWVLGSPIVTNVVISEMNQGQINSIIITVIASFIVLTVIFFALERSLILGLLTTIPVTIVILWILGSMLFFGYDLNVMTITIASLTVGMGITYSIHITERFVEDLKIFKTPGRACENTLTHTGMALAGAFATTAGGFGILFFHRLPPLQQFGVLIALSITYSFLASTYILPTFLILWAKWRIRREQAKVAPRKKGKKRPISKDLAHKKRMPKGTRKPKRKKRKK